MPLLQDDKDSEPEEPYEFEEGQESVAKLVHLVCHKANFDVYYEILLKFKRVFVKGGIKRMKYSIPALCFALFKLSNELTNGVQQNWSQGFSEGEEQQVQQEDDEPQIKLQKVDHKKIYKLLHELI